MRKLIKKEQVSTSKPKTEAGSRPKTKPSLFGNESSDEELFDSTASTMVKSSDLESGSNTVNAQDPSSSGGATVSHKQNVNNTSSKDNKELSNDKTDNNAVGIKESPSFNKFNQFEPSDKSYFEDDRMGNICDKLAEKISEPEQEIVGEKITIATEDAPKTATENVIPQSDAPDRSRTPKPEVVKSAQSVGNEKPATSNLKTETASNPVQNKKEGILMSPMLPRSKVQTKSASIDSPIPPENLMTDDNQQTTISRDDSVDGSIVSKSTGKFKTSFMKDLNRSLAKFPGAESSPQQVWSQT